MIQVHRALEECSTVVDLLRLRALHQPQQRAYTFLSNGEIEGATLTYAELDCQARALGAVLQNMQAQGQRGLMLYPPGLQFIEAFFGCLYAGVVAVPISPPHPARLEATLPKLRAVVANAQPQIGLTTSSLLTMVEGLFPYVPYLRDMHWISTDGVVAGNKHAWHNPVVHGDSLAFLQYTSGSTAEPRGVMVSHANILHNQRMIRSSFDHNEQSTTVGWLPLYHDMGLIGNVLQPLYIGSSCILMPPVSFLAHPFRWLNAISNYQAHTSGGPNFAYDLCVQKVTPEQRHSLDLTSWRIAFNGAEPVYHRTLERFLATFAECGLRRETLYPCYGLAEATLFARAEPPDA